MTVTDTPLDAVAKASAAQRLCCRKSRCLAKGKGIAWEGAAPENPSEELKVKSVSKVQMLLPPINLMNTLSSTRSCIAGTSDAYTMTSNPGKKKNAIAGVC